MSYSTRSGRQVIRKRHFDEISTSIDPKQRKKARSKRAKPTVDALTEAPALTEQIIRQRAQFTPPIEVAFTEFEVLWTEREPINLFLRFLGAESLTAIVEATNRRAKTAYQQLKENVSQPRFWRPTTRGEFLQWLGILFHMGRHIEKCREDYWHSYS